LSHINLLAHISELTLATVDAAAMVSLLLQGFPPSMDAAHVPFFLAYQHIPFPAKTKTLKAA
jgi:hypothetical protein